MEAAPTPNPHHDDCATDANPAVRSHSPHGSETDVAEGIVRSILVLWIAVVKHSPGMFHVEHSASRGERTRLSPASPALAPCRVAIKGVREPVPAPSGPGIPKVPSIREDARRRTSSAHRPAGPRAAAEGTASTPRSTSPRLVGCRARLWDPDHGWSLGPRPCASMILVEQPCFTESASIAWDRPTPRTARDPADGASRSSSRRVARSLRSRLSDISGGHLLVEPPP